MVVCSAPAPPGCPGERQQWCPRHRAPVVGTPPQQQGEQDIPPGERLHVETSRRGGYGDPSAWDPALVAADLKSGLVTVQAAERDYGQRTRLTGAITLSRTTQEGGSEDPDRERPQPSRVDCSAGPGNSFHSSPSGKRPPAFGCAPPHCLKKNASPPFRYMSWIRRAESGCMGRTRKPLSPSTIAHAMSRKSTSSTGPRSGSKEMKRTWELISLRWVMPLTWAASSTGTPCGGTSLPP